MDLMPNEIIIIILDELDTISKLRISQVCRKLYLLVGTYEETCIDIFDCIINNKLISFGKYIEHLTIGNIYTIILQIAYYANSIIIFRYLRRLMPDLLDFQMDPNKLLEWACTEGNIVVVQFLIKKCVGIKKYYDKPSFCAMVNGHDQILDLLIKNNFEIYPSLLVQ